MPARSTSASCGLGAIQRTCDVHGRGGKLHDGRDGSSSSASSSRHVSPRRQLEQRLELAPRLAAIVAAEETARLRPRVHGAVDGADRERIDARLRQPAVDPRRTAVRRASHTAVPQARVDRVGVLRIHRQALGAAARQ
jgi:hypothetical protein